MLIEQNFSTISQGRCWTHKNKTFLLGFIKLTSTVADFKSNKLIYLLVYLTALSVSQNYSFEWLDDCEWWIGNDEEWLSR